MFSYRQAIVIGISLVCESPKVGWWATRFENATDLVTEKKRF